MENFIESGFQKWELKIHEDPSFGLYASQKLKFLSKNILIACCQEKTVIKLIDCETGQLKGRIFDSEKNIFFKDYISDAIRSVDIVCKDDMGSVNPMLFCGMDSGKLVKLDPFDDMNYHVVSAFPKENYLRNILFSKDLGYIGTSGEDCFKLWDIQTLSLVSSFPLKPGKEIEFLYIENGTKILTWGSYSDIIRVRVRYFENLSKHVLKIFSKKSALIMLILTESELNFAPAPELAENILKLAERINSSITLKLMRFRLSMENKIN